MNKKSNICPSPSAHWYMDCSDNCHPLACDNTGYNLYINGNSGKPVFNNDLYINDIFWEEGCDPWFDESKLHKQ